MKKKNESSIIYLKYERLYYNFYRHKVKVQVSLINPHYSLGQFQVKWANLQITLQMALIYYIVLRINMFVL